MKIITKPLTGKDEISKSRHLTGFDRWARSSPTIGFFLLILEWFTVPFEIIFRRDFGQRWLTSVNFIAGGILISIFGILQSKWHYITNLYNSGKITLWHFLGIPADTGSVPDSDKIAVYILIGLFYLYLILGFYQIFKTKWRNQVNIPLHSFDDGTSRFLWLAAILKWILNILATPFMVMFWLFLPRKQRRGKPFPKLISNHEVFANVIIEPGLVFVAAILMPNVSSVYLALSAFALFLHANRKEMARKSKMLDFQDSKIEAEIMKELRNAASRSTEIVKKAKSKMPKQDKKLETQTFDHYPKLAVIIEELNAEWQKSAD